MRWLFVLACSLFLHAQTLPDGDALTKQAGEAVKKFHTLQYTAEMTMETTVAGNPMKMTSSMSWALVNPGKSRIEAQTQGISTIVISDGEFTWMYSSLNKQYTKTAAALGPSAIFASLGMKMPDLASLHTTTTTLREETIEIDGEKHPCWVVEMRMGSMTIPVPQNDKASAEMNDAVTTLWIDKKLLIDLQSTLSMKVKVDKAPEMEMRQRTVKKNLKIDEPVADAMFVFTPPAESKEVKTLSFAAPGIAKPDLAGKPAPAFEVKSLDGKSYSLAALKGKPVLLDFWATWCVPCRRSTPSVEKIYAEYKDQGLVILAVNTAEDRALVDEFLRKNPLSYPAVLSGESGILEAYKITAYPTFVLIGRDGKVAAHEIGFTGEDMLRGMLEKLKP